MYRGFNLLLEDNDFERDYFECLQKVGLQSLSDQGAKIRKKNKIFCGWRWLS